MALLDETWYKELEDPDTFYTKVTALKLLNHLTEFCVGLHTLDAVDIPQIMKSLYKDLEGVPQFINAMKAAQRKSKRAKLVINDKYLHAVALKSLLQSVEYETETREWSKLPEDKQTWEDWKTTSCAAYVAKRQSKAAGEGERKTFGRLALLGVAPVKKERTTRTKRDTKNVPSNARIFGGLPQQHCSGSDADGGDSYTFRGISGNPSCISGHGCKSIDGNQETDREY